MKNDPAIYQMIANELKKHVVFDHFKSKRLHLHLHQI